MDISEKLKEDTIEYINNPIIELDKKERNWGYWVFKTILFKIKHDERSQKGYMWQRSKSKTEWVSRVKFISLLVHKTRSHFDVSITPLKRLLMVHVTERTAEKNNNLAEYRCWNPISRNPEIQVPCWITAALPAGGAFDSLLLGKLEST